MACQIHFVRCALMRLWIAAKTLVPVAVRPGNVRVNVALLVYDEHGKPGGEVILWARAEPGQDMGPVIRVALSKWLERELEAVGALVDVPGGAAVDQRVSK